jgi:hypothetical protein
MPNSELRLDAVRALNRSCEVSFWKISPLTKSAINRFRVDSVSGEIVSVLAQHAFGCPSTNCPNLSAGEVY